MSLSVCLRRACVPVLLALLCAAGSAALDTGDARAASALPAMGNAGNTTERGMGYTDAYGRPLKDYGPEEVKPRKRPRGGAYGTYGRKQSRPLPDPDADTPGKPAWDFN